MVATTSTISPSSIKKNNGNSPYSNNSNSNRQTTATTTSATTSSATPMIANTGGAVAATSADVAVRTTPTEAQLRWAQFHAKRRANLVQSHIQTLYQSPATLEDVSGALPEDGNSSTSVSDDSIQKLRRRRKVMVSRGRRAMLRVSRRAYYQRKALIAKEGFQYFSDNEEDDEDKIEQHIHEEDEEEEAANEALDIFTTQPKHMRRRRRRRRKTAEEEGFKRFQAACHAMMMNLAAPPKQSIVIPTRIWTRTVDPAAALDENYLDPKWGVLRKPHDSASQHHHPHVDAYYDQAFFKPMDAGASWMMHLPKTGVSATRDNPYSYRHYHPSQYPVVDSAKDDDGTSSAAGSTSTLALMAPGQQKFNQLLGMVQQRMIERSRQQNIDKLERFKRKSTDPKTMRLRADFSVCTESNDDGDSRRRHTHSPQRLREDRLATFHSSSPRSSLPNLALSGGASGGPPKPSRFQTRRTSQHVPKMRLREFEGSNNGTRKSGKSNSASSPSSARKAGDIPKMKLRDLNLPPSTTSNSANPAPSTGRTQDLAQNFDGPYSSGRNSSSKTKQMAQRLEGPPRMKLQRHSEEKKLNDFYPEDSPIRRKSSDNPKVHRLSQQYQPQPMPPDTCCAKCRRSSSASLPHFNNNNRMSTVSNNSLPLPAPNMETGSNRGSDFFSHVRQQNQHVDYNKKRQQQSEDTTTIPPPEVERQMTLDSQRESDFFAQIRQLNADGPPICEDCQLDQVEAIAVMYYGGDDVPSPSSSFTSSPVKHLQQQLNQSPSTALRHSWEPRSNRATATASTISSSRSVGYNLDDDDGKSDVSKESAVSELWNRGRSSLNMFASSLNAISEQPPQKTAEDVAKRTTVLASKLTGRVVGGLFSPFKKPTQQKKDDSNHENPPNQAVDGMVKSPSLDYNSDNDMEAMAAYRKSQEMKRGSMGDFDESSQSSYSGLPDNIRDVVKIKGQIRPQVTGKDRDQQLLHHLEEEVGDHSIPQPSQSYRLSRGVSDKEVDRMARLRMETPNRSSSARSTVSHATSIASSLTPEKYKEIHEKVIRESPLLGDGERERVIIDTDDTTSDASQPGYDPSKLASLMLSPDLLQRRLRQAILAVEERKWDQVTYLIHANPWLAEMCELTSNQYLLHKLAYFGTDAPDGLCKELMEMFPSAVHKFDQDGNVPLHLAAAAGHLKMVEMLGNKFAGGASIRNEDGMLPLHFTITSYCQHCDVAAYGDSLEDTDENPSPLRVIKMVLKLFPQAVAVADNDGNLPLHLAVECLEGGLGVDVIYLLLDEADRQLQDPFGARFYNKVKLEELPNDDMSATTIPTDVETDSTTVEEDMQSTMVRNEFGETPLTTAVKSRKGWEMIEAIVAGPGGRKAALFQDAQKNNVLHLLVSEFQDPAAAMSILKVAPETATARNSEGMLPIECACLQLIPEEVILAIALVDLPIDLDDKDGIKVQDNFGGSWWYLTSECDDHYYEIVEQVVSLCTFQQIRALCFMKRGEENQNTGTVIYRATPKCKELLSKALRFVGRYEFLGNSALHSDPETGLQEFKALDFGGTDGNHEGRPVLLKCYSMQGPFLNETTTLREFPLDTTYVEEITTFVINEEGAEGVPQQFCVSVEHPQITLDMVVDGMVKKGRYQYDLDLRRKYAAKICSVLRLIAKALRHLHTSGVVHGHLAMENCGEFDHKWKLSGRLNVQAIGKPFDPYRSGKTFPPETLKLDEENSEVFDSDAPPVSFRGTIVTDPSIDIWAFGMLAYEAIVGTPLIAFDSTQNPYEDSVSMLEVLEWDQSNMKDVFTTLLDSGVTESCAELLTSCLFPSPVDRPKDMDAILTDPFWKDMRQYRQSSSSGRRPRRRDDSTESSRSVSIFNDTSTAIDTSMDVDTAEI